LLSDLSLSREKEAKTKLARFKPDKRQMLCRTFSFLILAVSAVVVALSAKGMKASPLSRAFFLLLAIAGIWAALFA
jgi:hypothetical protein